MKINFPEFRTLCICLFVYGLGLYFVRDGLLDIPYPLSAYRIRVACLAYVCGGQTHVG